MKLVIPALSKGDHYLRLHQELLKVRSLRRAGKLDEAQSICESLLAQCPDYVGALQSLGWIHYTKGRYQQALSCFVQANMHNPDNSRILVFLANTYLRLGARVVAAQTLERALELEPDNANVQHTLGSIYREENEFEVAARCYEKALALNPESITTADALAKCCIQLGRFEEAATVLGRAFKIQPQSHKILFTISFLPQAFVKIDLLAAVDHCRKPEPEDKEFDNTNLFIRAIALGSIGHHQRAWELLVDANRRLNAESANAYQRRRQKGEASLRQAEAFVPAPPAGQRPQRRVPLSLFILGPSRCGKTTVELLTSSVAGVKRGYENLIVDNAVARAAQSAGLPTVRRAASMLSALEPDFTEAYLRELEKRASGARVFTNTNPGIIHDVGRLSCLVPGARFVFVKRNIDDVALRIFMMKYDAGNDYGYDLGNIRAQIAWYYRMADVWAEKLPQTSLILNYEDAIADPRASRVQICGLLGLAVPRGRLPRLGDDRGCAKPYKTNLDAELSR